MKVTNNYDGPFYSNAPIPPVNERPCCPGCGKTRKVYRVPEKLKESAGPEWRYNGYGFFCSLRCAANYANRLIKKSLK